MIAAIAVAAVVAATASAIVVTQDFRDQGTVISQVREKRVGSRPPSGGPQPRFCPQREDEPGLPISFYLPRDDELTVALLRRGEVVRTLARERLLRGGRRHCFPWDGTDDAGNPAPPGFYRLQVTLERADRTATAGRSVELLPEGTR